MTDTGFTIAAMPSALSAAHGARMRDYFELLKPRVMSLVVFSGLVGMMAAPGHIHPLLGFIAILSIALSAGGCGAVNMWYDRDIDAVMTRTCERPLPQGRVVPSAAAEFGMVLIIGAVLLMGMATNWVAAGFLAAAAAFYILVYTMWLKRRTPQNIVIGGAAGAFPPVIGWTAVTGQFDWEPWLLFALIFFWTPPHFWALALFRNEDYARANIPMLPVVAGERTTKLNILAYTLLLCPLALAPWFVGMGGAVYLVGASALSALFVIGALRVLRDETHRSAKQLFAFSIFYLFVLLSLLLSENLWAIWGQA